MRSVPALLIGVACSTIGCSDDRPPADPYRCLASGGEACFQLPTDVVGAADVSGAAAIPIIACGAYEVASSPSPIAFSGHIVDFGTTDSYLSGVRLETFSDLTMTDLRFDVTSDADGAWAATASVPSLAYGRTTSAGQLPLYFMYGRIEINDAVQDNFDFPTASKAQVTSALELVGDRFLPGKSQVAATARDCAGNRLVNVIGNIAPASGRNGSRLFESNVRAYYGIEGSLPVLGRRTELLQTTSAGVIGFTNLAPGHHFVQLWGFPDEAALAQGSVGLKLLDEKELIVFDDEAAYGIELDARL